MRNFIKNKFLINVLITLSITLVYFLVVKTIFGFAYRINDDQAMMNILSGNITGTPDAHAIFIQYPLGYLISSLYVFKSGYDWYAFIMILFNFSSIFFILYRMISVKENIKKKIIFISIFLFLFSVGFIFEIVTFQFTTVAAMLGAATLFWLFTMKTNLNVKDAVLNYLVAIMLFIGSFCVRIEIGLVTLVVAAVLWFFKWSGEKKRFSKGTIVRYLSLIFIVIICAGVIKNIDNQAYSSKEWQDYKEYNKYRSGVCDFYEFPDYGENQDFYNSLGITYESYELMINYCLIVDEATDQKAMKSIYEKAKQLNEVEKSTANRIKDVARDFYKKVFDTYYLPVSLLVVFLFLGLIVAFLKRKDYRNVSLVLGFILVKLLLWSYLIFAGRTVERVGISLYIIDLIVLAAMFFENRDEIFNQKISLKIKENIFVKILFITLFLFVLLTSMYKGYSTTKAISLDLKEKAIAREELDEYMLSHPNNVYFFDINVISKYTWKINSTSTGKYINAICLGGWTAFSPQEEKKIADSGINNIQQSLLEKDNTFIIADEKNIKIYIDYFSIKYEKFGYKTVDILTTSSNEEFYIYDFYLN